MALVKTFDQIIGKVMAPVTNGDWTTDAQKTIADFDKKQEETRPFFLIDPSDSDGIKAIVKLSPLFEMLGPEKSVGKCVAIGYPNQWLKKEIETTVTLYDAQEVKALVIQDNKLVNVFDTVHLALAKQKHAGKLNMMFINVVQHIDVIQTCLKWMQIIDEFSIHLLNGFTCCEVGQFTIVLTKDREFVGRYDREKETFTVVDEFLQKSK